ncbi:hypothetical protein [Paraglaciecola sp. L3A3]|uniref:hypothetical protein n=1 Tax=Paraglaciecola sp. L3A3 TaxID=2686358 RepID=UPI0018EF0AB8
MTAQLIDENGFSVYHKNKQIEFNISDALSNLGVDNGASDNIQKHQNNKLTTHKGRALLIVQSKNKTGKANITASFDTARKATVNILIK